MTFTNYDDRFTGSSKKCIRIECDRGFLPLSEFNLNSQTKDGHSSYCRLCAAKVSKERYLLKKDEISAYYRGLKRINKTCSVCGKGFLTRNEKTLVCSRSCASTLGKINWRTKRIDSQQYIEERLWSKIKKGTEAECWEWQGQRDLNGYGTLIFLGKRIPAHRLVCKFTHEDFDESLLACHKCDNPPCCNPGHIYPGTYKNNSDDKHQRGRANIRKGENNGRAKVTVEQVFELRNLFANGISRAALATKFGLNWTTVDNIIKRKLWKEVA